VLHVMNAALVFLILQRMTAAPWRSGMVAALFAWHPMHVESVAWIAERKDLLSTFLWLLTLGAYLRYAENLKSQISNFKFYYIAAVLFFALAIMAKPMVVTLPFLLLLLDWWPLRRWQLTWPRLVLEKVPFFLLSAFCCVLTFIAQKRGGAVSPLDTIPLHFRMYNIVMSYWRYIGKLLAPVNMAAIYPILREHRSVPLAAVGLLALLAVSVAVIMMRDKRPYWGVGWFWYLGTLVPVIGVIQVGAQTMADRYTYVPSLGLFILVCWTVYDWAIKWRHGRLVLALAAVATLAACVCATARQLQYWRNGETLWTHAIAVTQNNYIALEAYEEYLAENGRWDEARTQGRKALEIVKDFSPAQLWLGIILCHEGKFDEAIREITPTLKDGWNVERGEEYLGKIALAQNLPVEAAAAFSKEMVLNPALPAAHCGLGQALARQGKTDAARKEFQEALRLLPDYPEASNSLARLAPNPHQATP
jgi:Tfp pilus assembly protein PilF